MRIQQTDNHLQTTVLTKTEDNDEDFKQSLPLLRNYLSSCWTFAPFQYELYHQWFHFGLLHLNYL